MRCALFEINTNLLKIYKHINILTEETLQPSFIWKILSKYISPFCPNLAIFFQLVLSVKDVFKSIQVLNMFTSFTSKYFLHFQRKLVLSIAEVPGNIHFLPLLLVLRMGQVFNITNKYQFPN